MTQSIQSAAAATLAEVEKVTAVILPEPGTAIVPLSEAKADQAAAIRTRMAELDLTNTQSIIGFGSAAQSELQVISQEMLSGVKNKDVGPAGDSLRDIVTTLRARLESLPAQLGPQVAAVSDEGQCTAMIADHVEAALAELSHQAGRVTE